MNIRSERMHWTHIQMADWMTENKCPNWIPKKQPLLKTFQMTNERKQKKAIKFIWFHVYNGKIFFLYLLDFVYFFFPSWLFIDISMCVRMHVYAGYHLFVTFRFFYSALSHNRHLVYHNTLFSVLDYIFVKLSRIHKTTGLSLTIFNVFSYPEKINKDREKRLTNIQSIHQKSTHRRYFIEQKKRSQFNEHKNYTHIHTVSCVVLSAFFC